MIDSIDHDQRKGVKMGSEGVSPAFKALYTGSAAQEKTGEDDVQTQRPSIFDILAEENLTSSLKPALKTALKFAFVWSSDGLQVLDRFYDEIYGCLLMLVENYHLRRYSASFSEAFYGMKRVPLQQRVGDAQDTTMSSSRRRCRSLIFLVILPYLSTKLDRLRERLEGMSPQRVTKTSRFLLTVYRYVKPALIFAFLLFQLTYGFSLSNQSSPLLWLAGVRLQKVSAQELGSPSALPVSLGKSGFLSRLYLVILQIPSFIGRLFSYGLFLIQFLEHFYTSDVAGQFALLGMKSATRRLASAPPHPILTRRETENEVLQMDAGKCPICYRSRVRDTALAVSGYVFCYRCISDWLGREGRCPVTNLPASAEHLIRIYTDENASVS